MIKSEDTGLAVHGSGDSGEAVTPTVSTRGRKGGILSAAAKRKADQALKVNGFAQTIEQARGTAQSVEGFAQTLEDATTEYCADRLAAVPHNIQARVIEEVAAADPADFRGFNDAIRSVGGAADFFTFLQTANGTEGE
jgi:hypothetical protein